MISPNDSALRIGLQSLQPAVAGAANADGRGTHKLAGNGADWFEDTVEIRLTGASRGGDVHEHAREVLAHLCAIAQSGAE